ncbi:MAG: topoisomerase DNA-binding C4 zinc finger domain-containing protein, partial [Phycisphaerae bacterium]
RPIDQLEQLRNAAQQRQEADARTRPANDRGNGTEAGSPRGRAARASARKADKPVVRDLDSPTACPQCGGQMVLKLGRFGPFLSCGNYPQCKATARLEGQALQQAEQRLGAASARPAPEPTDIDCDQCGAKMVIRTGRTGRFLACSSYPKCKNTGPLPAGKTQTR